jgi:hypothetical protein
MVMGCTSLQYGVAISDAISSAMGYGAVCVAQDVVRRLRRREEKLHEKGTIYDNAFAAKE